MTDHRPPKNVALALSWGALTHLCFAAGVGTMFLSLYTGLQHGLGPFSGPFAWFSNLLLALQFPLLHSWLLTPQGRAFLARLAPGGPTTGRTLAPSTYALIGGLQLLLTFVAWSPTGPTIFASQGTVFIVLSLLFLAAWGLLGLAILNSGLGLQSGFIGWWALLRGRPVRYPDLPETWLYALIRHPIYLSFALTLWFTPTWTGDQLLLASVWTVYCVVAPRLKERRLEAIHGARFRAYRDRVPYMMPRPRARQRRQNA